MKRSVLTVALLVLGMFAPSIVAAQDSSASQRPSADVLRLRTTWARLRSLTFLDTSGLVRSNTALPSASRGPRTDMGVLSACPMPRAIPDTARVIAMPRFRIDSAVDSRMPRTDLRCEAKIGRN